MTKQEFLDRLEAGLAGTGDGESVLEFYREMIADRMEDGMAEEEAVAQVGTVEEILANCVQSVTVVPRENGAQAAKIRRVVIQEREFDIHICPTQEPRYRLEGQDRYHEVRLEDGTLRILRNKEPLPRRLFSSSSGEMTLYLPQGCYESLDITTASGGMEIAQSFDSVRVSGASSDIALSGTFGGRVEIQTASGDVELGGIFGDALHVKTASGDVELNGRFSQRVQIQTGSGEISVKEAGFGSVDLRTASGDIDLYNVLADTLEIHCASGDLELNRVCGKSLVLESGSGDMDLEDRRSAETWTCSGWTDRTCIWKPSAGTSPGLFSTASISPPAPSPATSTWRAVPPWAIAGSQRSPVTWNWSLRKNKREPLTYFKDSSLLTSGVNFFH